MAKEWRLADIDLRAAQRISKSLDLTLAASKILVARGLTKTKGARAWLSPSLNDLHKPQRLLGATEAVKLLCKAIEARTKIHVFGDFDVDGVTSAALLTTALEAVGADVTAELPDRFRDGYGLNRAAVTRASEAGVGLLVTVDCGISNQEEIALAVEAGLSVIVVDHHEPPPELPPAECIINPRLPDCNYPFKDMAAVGLVFKLVDLLGQEFARPDLAMERLDLVALGTVADLAPLVGENRILATHGLEKIKESPRPGLRSLIKVSGLEAAHLTASDISFGLAPRLNAAGRLGSARISYDLLTTSDPAKAAELAAELNKLNTERRRLEQTIYAEALVQIEAAGVDDTIVVASPDWHEGVKGIVASRLVERFFRPVILFTIRDGMAVGSARTIPAFNIYAALEACSDHLVKWGGHRAAAGLSLKETELKNFKESFSAYAREHLNETDFVECLPIDFELSPDQISERLLDELCVLSPYGIGNPTPTFSLRNVYIDGHRSMGSDANHLKFLAQAGNFSGEAVAFKVDKTGILSQGVGSADIALQLSRNRFRGRSDMQIQVVDARPAARILEATGTTVKAPPAGTGFFLPEDTPAGADVDAVCFIDQRGAQEPNEMIKNLLEAGLSVDAYVRDEHEGVQLANDLGRITGGEGAGLQITCGPSEESSSRLVLYQMPLTARAMLGLCGGSPAEGKKIVYLLFGEADLINARWAIESICPDRARLAQVFRLLRDAGPFDIDEAALHCRQQLGEEIYPPATRRLAARAIRILAELKLLNKDEAGRFEVVGGAAKARLEQSASWIRAAEQRREFERFAKIALTAPPGRLLRFD